MRTAGLLLAVCSLLACRSSGASKPPPDEANALGASLHAPTARPVHVADSKVPAPSTVPALAAPAAGTAAPPTASPGTAASTASAPGGPARHNFIAEVGQLRDVALCGATAKWTKAAAAQSKHCQRIARIQQTYRERWLTPALAFFAAVVPAGLPTTVVYPFAGGDLATALTVFPAASEITTLSLEPAGDPRTLAALGGTEIAAALGIVADELDFLYRINFSNTMNLIAAMRGGKLPTQLVFSLSAMELHGQEVVAAYFFDIAPNGGLDYIDDADLASMPPVERKNAAARNRRFGNVELQFRKPGDAQVRVYRHIQWNLDDEHLTKDPRVIQHLAAKGQVAAMTKAASYLLHWDSFSTIRTYLLDHMAWMVSDASGLRRSDAAAAGWSQDVWGTFAGAHMTAGRASNRGLFKLFHLQPKRAMPVRFGYPDRTGKPHLIVTRRT